MPNDAEASNERMPTRGVGQLSLDQVKSTRAVLSTFLYPWDLAARGTTSALDKLQSDGFEAIDLAATYHPITLFSPGTGTAGLVHLPRGGVLFPARTDRYSMVKPNLWGNPAMIESWLEAGEHAHSRGLALNAWVVGSYQPWIVDSNPDCARVLPSGLPTPGIACPASPKLRSFLCETVSDLAGQVPLGMVQLEGVSFAPYDYKWPDHRTLMPISPWHKWLLGFCFCTSCIDRGQQAGADVEGLRQRICRSLEDVTFVASRPVSEQHQEMLQTDLDYANYWNARESAPIELVRGVAEALEEVSPGTTLSVWGPTDSSGNRWRVNDVLDIIGALETNELAYEGSRQAARDVIADRNVRVRSAHWCGLPIGEPLGSEFRNNLAGALAFGVDQLDIYNWAMLPAGVASQIEPLVRAIEKEFI